MLLAQRPRKKAGMWWMLKGTLEHFIEAETASCRAGAVLVQQHSRRRVWLLLPAPVPRTPAPGP